MAYVSLYRKYRPQTFDEVVGQDHVTRSLSNALREDRLHHAYLLAGPRGTGKTSTARILAKSINCVEGPTAEPCNTCAQCVAITTGASVDVIELDMASHGGVDDARELRDRAQFAPASARRKVYILDEVHMASTAAFNALLKLIEEPPAHVLFAMATTDPQKVLPTILSRVQRLDLRRVGAADVAGRVRDLVSREGGTIDDVAVDLVVRAGDGSVRDTESVLEQVLAYADGEVTGDDVAEVLGQTTFEHTATAVETALGGDLAGAFAKVQDLLDDGTDLRQFTLDLVAHVRDLLVLVVAPDRPDLVDATPDRRDALADQALRMDRDGLAHALDQLAVALEQMRQGPARLALELALARIATRPGAPVARPAATPPNDDATSTVVEDEPATQGDLADDDPVGADDQSAVDHGEPVEEGEPAVVDVGGPAPEDELAVGPDEPDVAVDEPDVAVDEPVVAVDEPDVAVDEPDVAGEEPDAAGEEPVVVDEPDVVEDPAPADGDLSSRATARADRIARDGLPDVPSDRPAGPEVTVDDPPTTDEAADLETIVGRWESIQDLVGEQSKKGMAMLSPARPVRLRGGVLTVEYPASHAFHASSMLGEFIGVLGTAVTEATGLSPRLAIHVEGEGPRRPQPPPMEAGPDDGATRAADEARSTEAPADRPDEPPRAVPTPLADLDPAEAMDRAAGALVEHLDATELAAD